MILTDEEISEMWLKQPAGGCGIANAFARAIEAAVLEKLRKQEPVVTINQNASGQIHMVCANGNSFDISKHVGKSFYASLVPTAAPEGD